MHIYRRHAESCKHKHQRLSRKCDCPLWAKGALEGQPYQRSLKTRSIERAEQLLKQILNGGSPQRQQPKEEPKDVTLEDALDRFIKDGETRHLSKPTLGKYRLLQGNLIAFAKDRGINRCVDFTPDTVRDFRSSRNIAARTDRKELERVRAFFKFCLESEWITKNPAKDIKPPKIDTAGVAPFPLKIQEQILAAAYGLSNGQKSPKGNVLPVNSKTGTFIKLLLNTGLRITDAAMLLKNDIQNGRLIIKAGKNNSTISIALPPDLVSELDAIPSHQFFQSPLGSTRPETVSDYWRDQINKVFDHLGIEGHPHQFRHSLVMNMLHAGSSIEDAARVIGDSPTIVAKHYWQFCIDTQTRIDAQLQKTWKKTKPALQLVNG